MPWRAFPRPRRVLGLWAVLLFLAAAALIGAQAALHRSVAAARANHPWTYLRLAEQLKSENRTAEALAALQRAADLDPALPAPHEEMGRLYYARLSDWKNALEAYRRAYERGSRNEEVMSRTLWCLIQLGRYRDAAEFGRYCLDKGFTHPDFTKFIAEAYRRAGLHRESIPYFERAVKEFPGDSLLLERLMQAYEHAGEMEKAAEIKLRLDRTEG